MKNLLLAVLVTVSFSAIAGDKGNGGDVVVCNDSVQLLDRLEAQKKKLKLNLPAGSIEEKVKAVGDRLLKLDTIRGELFRKYTSDLLVDIKKRDEGSEDLKAITFVDEVLSDIDDSFEFSIPYGCKKEQLVIRREKEGIRMYDIYNTEYLINVRLWDLLDDENKAMTVSHEALYKIAKQELGHEDSRLARHLNGVLSSTTALSFEDYLSYVTSITKAFPFALKGEVIPDLLYSKSNFISAVDKRKLAANVDTSLMRVFEVSESGYVIKRPFLDEQFNFSKNGVLESVISKRSNYKEILKYKNASVAIRNSDSVSVYDSAGNLESVELNASGVKKLVVNNVSVKIIRGKKLQLLIRNRNVVAVKFV